MMPGATGTRAGTTVLGCGTIGMGAGTIGTESGTTGKAPGTIGTGAGTIVPSSIPIGKFPVRYGVEAVPTLLITPRIGSGAADVACVLAMSGADAGACWPTSVQIFDMSPQDALEWRRLWTQSARFAPESVHSGMTTPPIATPSEPVAVGKKKIVAGVWSSEMSCAKVWNMASTFSPISALVKRHGEPQDSRALRIRQENDLRPLHASVEVRCPSHVV